MISNTVYLRSRMAAAALLIGVLFVTKVTSQCSANSGATEKLRSVLEGRCLQYTKFVNADAFCDDGLFGVSFGTPTDRRVNCSAAAEAFITGFAHQDRCNVTMDRFQTFFDVTRHARPAGKSMFWESVYDFVHEYSQGGKRASTLEDTLPGYMIDRLRFCSDPAQPDGIGGPTTQNCPSFEETDGCPWNAEYSFWAAASRNYASHASGYIKIMLNASTGSAFNDETFFGHWELPNLTKDVTHADIWLVHVPDQGVKETCESESISDLAKKLKAKNITSTCVENPSDVAWLLCWDNRDAAECRLLSSNSDAVLQSFTLCTLFALFTIISNL